MGHQSAAATADRSRAWTLLALLYFTALVAVPLACFSAYWRGVNDTVDGSTIALQNAPGSAKLAFVLGVGAVVLTLGALLAKRRWALSTMYIVLLCAAWIGLGSDRMTANVTSPDRTPNPLAMEHRDSMISTADVVEKFVRDSGSWPRSWDDLQGIDPTLDVEALASHVTIDFAADLRTLRGEKWYEFSGIIPRKPCYNDYRDSVIALLATLRGENSAGHISGTADLIGSASPSVGPASK